MAEENALELLRETLAQLAVEIMRLTPKILIALVIFALAFLSIKAITISFRRILRITRLDSMFKQLSGFSLPFSLDSLIISLANLGVTLISIYAIVNLFLGTQYLQILNDGLYYGARVFSIIMISIFILTVFNLLMHRISIEDRLRSYMMFITILLVTAMSIDITALSDPMKNALISGLSTGVGISIGVFVVWFFFHDYFDQMLKAKTLTQPEERRGERNREKGP